MTELYLYGKASATNPGGLFQSILNQSQTIKGNYHVSPNYGHDLNTNNLDEYVKGGQIKRYPVAVCMTPVSRLVEINGGTYEQFTFNIFFLTLDKRNDDGTLKDKDADIYASGSTPPDDWAAMNQVATNFMLAFSAMKRDFSDRFIQLRQILQLDANRAEVRRITRRGSDVYNGVSLTFTCLLQSAACLITDYGEEWLTGIVLPEINPAP